MSNTKIKAGQFSGIVGNGTDGYFLMTNGDGTMAWSSIIINPTIASIAYPGSATAADPAGGETITVTGTGFSAGATVTVGGTTAPAVSYVSGIQITFTTPAKAAGDYDIVVTNTDTGSATYINGISYNGIPTWTTAAGSLGTFASGATISTITLQATEPDSGTITFNITNGALPTGLSLTGADIDGTTSLETADTLYTFTVTATDDESQATPRTFTITVEKAPPLNTDNFAPIIYTGNRQARSISTGFAPDFVWIKNRPQGDPHMLFDSVRGATKFLFSNGTDAEGTSATSLTSFNSDGFSLGAYDGRTNELVNYVAWCWKAGGVPTPNNNTQGTITSTVSANTEAGFSIVSFDNTTTGTETIGHGLSSAPELIIQKGRDSGVQGGLWFVYHSAIGATDFLRLNDTTQSQTNSTVWNDTEPTDSVFSIGSGSTINNYGLRQIAYCFHSVDGYQKVGSYTGTGSTQTINVGFDPRFVMFKRTDSTGEWTIIDNERNNGDNWLYANLTNAEGTNINRTTLVTGGFALDGSPSSCNESGSTYIYLAIA